MRKLIDFHLMVIQGATGPHDLGSGHNRKLPAQEDKDGPMGGDENRDAFSEDLHHNITVCNGPDFVVVFGTCPDSLMT